MSVLLEQPSPMFTSKDDIVEVAKVIVHVGTNRACVDWPVCLEESPRAEGAPRVVLESAKLKGAGKGEEVGTTMNRRAIEASVGRPCKLKESKAMSNLKEKLKLVQILFCSFLVMWVSLYHFMTTRSFIPCTPTLSKNTPFFILTHLFLLIAYLLRIAKRWTSHMLI